MKSLIIADTFYRKFLIHLEDALRDEESFENAQRVAFNSGFGTTGALSHSFSELGWQAFPIILNSQVLQNLWLTNNGFRKSTLPGWSYGPHIARMEAGYPLSRFVSHLHSSFLQQVKEIRPDVILIQDLNLISAPLAKELKKHCKLLVGEIASPLPPKRFLASYDLVFSALPPVVDRFKSLGIEAHFLPLGFDSRLIETHPEIDRDIDISFVGSAGKLWDTIGLLSAVVEHVPTLRIYGPISKDLLRESNLIENYFGEAWGHQMFEVFSRSKIALNRHGGIVQNFAGNMRMYEATGMGSVLLSEENDFVHKLFEPGVEIITYKNYEEAGSLAASLLQNPDLLKKIGKAGQTKTLSSHSYRQRAETMSQIMSDKLKEN